MFFFYGEGAGTQRTLTLLLAVFRAASKSHGLPEPLYRQAPAPLGSLPCLRVMRETASFFIVYSQQLGYTKTHSLPTLTHIPSLLEAGSEIMCLSLSLQIQTFLSSANPTLSASLWISKLLGIKCVWTGVHVYVRVHTCVCDSYLKITPVVLHIQTHCPPHSLSPSYLNSIFAQIFLRGQAAPAAQWAHQLKILAACWVPTAMKGDQSPGIEQESINTT